MVVTAVLGRQRQEGLWDLKKVPGYRKEKGAGQVNMSKSMPDQPSLFSGTNIVEEENWLPKVILGDTRTHACLRGPGMMAEMVLWPHHTCIDPQRDLVLCMCKYFKTWKSLNSKTGAKHFDNGCPACRVM